MNEKLPWYDDMLIGLFNSTLGLLVRTLIFMCVAFLAFFIGLWFILSILQRLWLDVPVILSITAMTGIAWLNINLESEYKLLD